MLLIDAKNISFSYGNKEILKNIDFQLNPLNKITFTTLFQDSVFS